MNNDIDDNTLYNVVVNDEDNYTIWPAYKPLPPGWRTHGRTGRKHECLDHVGQLRNDGRSSEWRTKMEIAASDL